MYYFIIPSNYAYTGHRKKSRNPMSAPIPS